MYFRYFVAYAIALAVLLVATKLSLIVMQILVSFLDLVYKSIERDTLCLFLYFLWC